jgi:hypothetical protein
VPVAAKVTGGLPSILIVTMPVTLPLVHAGTIGVRRTEASAWVARFARRDNLP